MVRPRRFPGALPNILAVALTAQAAGVGAQPLPCLPCAGAVIVEEAAVDSWLAALGGREAAAERHLWLAWELPLDGRSTVTARGRVQAAAAWGVTPWLRLRFRSPAPLADHPAALEAELAAAVAALRGVPPGTHVQIEWSGLGAGPVAWTEYRYLLKRAAVAIDGVDPAFTVVSATLPAAAAALEAFYDDEVPAYFEILALAADTPPAPDVIETAMRLDPGKPLAALSAAATAAPGSLLERAAGHATRGVALTLFVDPPRARAGELRLLAREFAGDLSPDPGSLPAGTPGWAFVRGSDLGLRIVLAGPPTSARPLVLPDPTLDAPLLAVAGAGTVPVGGQRTSTSLHLQIPAVAAPYILRLDRLDAGQIAGLESLHGEVEVQAEREVPVEEILRRLQAAEDAQRRRLHHYQAEQTVSMRFQVAGVGDTFEATFAGPSFVETGGESEWVWRDFYLNGVRWRGRRIPELPLVQPEKAVAQPVDIELGRDYDYRLRGRAEVAGRDCWVVDFAPRAAGAPEGSLYRGTVWIDREFSVRVRVRAVQVGLEGEVIANEERIDYRPVDASGEPATWSAQAFILPLETLSHQTFSMFNSTVAVERAGRLSDLILNGQDFGAARAAQRAGDHTMVRDTAAGLRYLVLDEETGERVVQEGFDDERLFLLGGTFYDDSLDYPLPLGGINYVDFDWRGTGAQFNLFFAGALLDLSLADPSLAGSRWDAGASLFALAVPGVSTVYRNGRKIPGEAVEVLAPALDLRLGRPVGTHGKLTAGYHGSYLNFGRAEDTDEEFRVPADHLEHAGSLTAAWDRAGYRLRARASWHRRQDWEAWGLPGSDFDPATRDYGRWRISVAKDFHFSGFRRFSAEIGAVGGEHLDRFSKYDFSMFSEVRVHGYRAGRVQAEEAWTAHLGYGVGLGDSFRLDLVGDGALASDAAGGLDQELLAGLGLVGSFLGPWETLIRVDLGVPVAGPDDGFTAYVAVLKLWK